MTLQELAEQLAELAENFVDADTVEVGLQVQPTYPLTKRLLGVYDPTDPTRELECASCGHLDDLENAALMRDGKLPPCCDDCKFEFPDEIDNPVLYLVASDSAVDTDRPYGTKMAWENF